MGTSVAALSEMWGELQRASGAMERTVELLGVAAVDRDARESGGAQSAPSRGRSPSSTCRSAIRRGPTRARSTISISTSRRAKPWPSSGPSGAGKSTVFQLLLRFYDPAAGRILIDGVDIAQRGSAARCARASASCRRKP